MTDLSDSVQADIAYARDTIGTILRSLSESVVGQVELCKRLVMGLITDGHILLEGVPGLAKTLSIKSLAAAIDASFCRIQFTPDLLPADIIGTEIYRPQEGRFEVRKGPIFANFILADEINRAPAKVQSALLETMQEHQVTIGGQTFRVPEPFFVMATQNPIEQEGTYSLPEAQIDRFLMKVKVSYPSPEDELSMLNVVDVMQPNLQKSPVTNLEAISNAKKACRKIYVDDRVKEYIVNLVWATREPAKYNLKLERLIELGSSPRGSIALHLASRAEALFNGESFVTPQNVKDVALDVLRHRVVPTYEAEAQGLDSDDIVRIILDGVQVP
jgi:MoxR-like ATPase